MNNNLAVSDETVMFENSINLKKFPPILRKVGKFMLQSDEPFTLMSACRAVNVNYDSIRTLINRSKRKGNDFQRFIDEQSSIFLHESKVGVYKALVNGAVSDSHMDRKLYFQLTGDLKETTNINVGTLAIGINITGVNPQDNERAAGVIDVEPVIPKGK